MVIHQDAHMDLCSDASRQKGPIRGKHDIVDAMSRCAMGLILQTKRQSPEGPTASSHPLEARNVYPE